MYLLNNIMEEKENKNTSWKNYTNLLPKRPALKLHPSARAISAPLKYLKISTFCATPNDSPPKPKITRPVRRTGHDVVRQPIQTSIDPSTTNADNVLMMTRKPIRSTQRPHMIGRSMLGME